MSFFLSIPEAAAWLGLTDSQVRTLVRRGMLEARNHGVRKKLMIPRSALEAFSESRRVEPEGPSLSRFQAARQRLRSLKTQEPQPKPERKGA